MEWKKPQVVVNWEKQQTKELAVHALLSVNKAVWLIMVVFLSLAYCWKPLVFSQTEFAHWFRVVALLSFLGPTPFTLLMIGPLFSPFSHKDRCTMNSRGIFCGNWFDHWNAQWKWVTHHRFVDHAEIADIRVVEINVKRFKIEKQGVWHAISFDPQMTLESEIETFIGRHSNGGSNSQ